MMDRMMAAAEKVMTRRMMLVLESEITSSNWPMSEESTDMRFPDCWVSK